MLWASHCCFPVLWMPGRFYKFSGELQGIQCSLSPLFGRLGCDGVPAGGQVTWGSCLICFNLQVLVVPVAVYGLHFPFSAFNTQQVFLLPNRVLSPCVCLFVGIKLFVDLAGRPSGRGHPCSQTHTKSFPLKEM